MSEARQSKDNSTAPPRDIKARTREQKLRIVWSGEDVCELPYVGLRAMCSCAECVDEWTGRRKITPSMITPDITIAGMELVGNYAVQITWSDGHETGLYTWARLRELCRAQRRRDSEAG